MVNSRFKTGYGIAALWLSLFAAVPSLGADGGQAAPLAAGSGGAVREMANDVEQGGVTGNGESFWARRFERRYVLNPGLALLALVLALSCVGLFAAVRGIGAAVTESVAARAEVIALASGDFMPLEKKKRGAVMRRQGISLRFKLASFTIVLVLLIVLMVSTPLYYMMTVERRETLLQGLWSRSTVLLEGLAAGARAYLPPGNFTELSYLPAQISAIPEARYVTITASAPGQASYSDCVWATNDPDILSKIDTVDFRPGVSLLTDALSPRLGEISGTLNARATVEAGDISRSISALSREAAVLSSRRDTGSAMRLNEIAMTIQSLESRLTQALAGIARQTDSEPEFSIHAIPPEGNNLYLLYKPVMYRAGSDDTFFQGLIRLEVSVEPIIGEITREQEILLKTIAGIALAALALGTIGALVLSNLLIGPIRKLVRHVEIIRDTEDKAKLDGLDIRIASRDELAVLGDTINDMTHGLVKAAAAASDLSIGREIQKKFIPLDFDHEGNKLNSGFKDTKNAQFFGYYEGAKGISGDYFDYQDLDGRYYAIIKCDVAGKGVPAALIMIQVATMFINYFKQWRPGGNFRRIEELVYQINGFIETLGFRGRFAAFTLCLFDSETGTLHFCNAGDNIVRLIDASEGRIKTITLPETPATGVLPNSLVESKGGYRVQTLDFDHGDILLLYTDGIEEAKRSFRDSDLHEISCSAGPRGTIHGNHVSGEGSEEMGHERVEAIINAVTNKEVYTLRKWHNGEAGQDLQFDFSSCNGEVEDVIMALISVEKMFRCYRDPRAGEDSRILVDKKIDDFLKAHFLQYRHYCSRTREYPGNTKYMYYTHVREDEQYDDLTILGIKRK